jgi:hypothetical protein
MKIKQKTLQINLQSFLQLTYRDCYYAFDGYGFDFSLCESRLTVLAALIV